MFSITVENYTLLCHTGPLPNYGVDYCEHACLVERFDEGAVDGDFCLLAVQEGLAWPFLVVTQRSRLPGIFKPSVLLIPETARLFLGVDERLLAYDLREPSRLWEEMTDCGVLGWARHGEFVVLSAELELAVWDLQGRKVWTTFVEPPWQYSVENGVVHLEVMGNQTQFPIGEGPLNG